VATVSTCEIGAVSVATTAVVRSVVVIVRSVPVAWRSNAWGWPVSGAVFVSGARNVTVIGELVTPLMVAVTESDPRTLLDHTTLHCPDPFVPVLQPLTSSEPTPGVEKTTGAPVVGVGVGGPTAGSLAVTVKVELVVPGRSTVARVAVSCTVSVGGLVPSTHALKCGRAALMV